MRAKKRALSELLLENRALCGIIIEADNFERNDFIYTTSKKEISVSDRELFKSYTSHIRVSFYNFSNLFMWRRVMNYRWGIIDGKLCIFEHYRSHHPHMMFPLEKGGVIDEKGLYDIIAGQQAQSDTLYMRPLNAEMANVLTSVFPNAITEERRSLGDYIYSIPELINLSGHKYHGKKNHVNEFIKNYSYEYHRISPDDISLLREAREALYKDDGDIELREEHDAIEELLDNFAALELKAAVITVGGKIAAYTIGEQMNSDTALIHIEKADRNFEGSYAMINNLFLKNEFSDLKYVNREEDMGIEGLRKAKLSYKPISITPIFTVAFTDEKCFEAKADGVPAYAL